MQQRKCSGQTERDHGCNRRHRRGESELTWGCKRVPARPQPQSHAAGPHPCTLVRDSYHLAKGNHQEAEPEIPDRSLRGHDEVTVVKYKQSRN